MATKDRIPSPRAQKPAHGGSANLSRSAGVSVAAAVRREVEGPLLRRNVSWNDGGQGRNRTADASLFRAALNETRLTDSARLTANFCQPVTPVSVTNKTTNKTSAAGSGFVSLHFRIPARKSREHD